MLDYIKIYRGIRNVYLSMSLVIKWLCMMNWDMEF